LVFYSDRYVLSYFSRASIILAREVDLEVFLPAGVAWIAMNPGVMKLGDVEINSEQQISHSEGCYD